MNQRLGDRDDESLSLGYAGGRERQLHKMFGQLIDSRAYSLVMGRHLNKHAVHFYSPFSAINEDS